MAVFSPMLSAASIPMMLLCAGTLMMWMGLYIHRVVELFFDGASTLSVTRIEGRILPGVGSDCCGVA